MPRHRIAAETVVEPAQEGFGQRDLGQQDEALAPLADRLGYRLEIHFGLARSGDAVEQHWIERARRDARDQRLRDAALFGR